MIVFGEHVCRWVAERTGGTYYSGAGQGIGLERDGELVAGVLYEAFNGRSVHGHLASDGTRRWMTREYLAFCFAYPFDQLKVNKIIGLVDSNNADALRLDAALGFIHEATLKDAGRTGDLLILTMTRAQCRFLDQRYANSLKGC